MKKITLFTLLVLFPNFSNSKTLDLPWISNNIQINQLKHAVTQIRNLSDESVKVNIHVTYNNPPKHYVPGFASEFSINPNSIQNFPIHDTFSILKMHPPVAQDLPIPFIEKNIPNDQYIDIAIIETKLGKFAIWEEESGIMIHNVNTNEKSKARVLSLGRKEPNYELTMFVRDFKPIIIILLEKKIK